MSRRCPGTIFGVLLSVAVASQACHRSPSARARGAGLALPVVGPDAGNLLLTWIDDKGDFHVETRVADVPLMGRDIVRVESESGDGTAGSAPLVVADLRQLGVNGSYPVRRMTRVEFEAIAVARREKAGPTLAGAAAPPGSASAPSGPPTTGRPPTAAVVVIYGAEWCSACHDAARYLRHKGIAYVEKDIEKDADAAREMQMKLARSGLRAGSIPVIDVRGKVMVGFDPAQIDAALGAAL